MKRRNFLKTSATMLLATTVAGCTQANNSKPGAAEESSTPAVNGQPATVYFTKEITPGSLIKIYRALGREATGKTGIKLSMGEPGGHNYLKPELVGSLVQLVNGTFIDANTAYGGNRATTELHLKAAEDHGFTAIAPVDILDSVDEIRLPVNGGKHLKYDIVGANFENYDFTLVLSHFKGHIWEDSEVPLKTYLLVLLRQQVKLISIQPVQVQQTGVIRHRTTSLSPWLKPPKL